jgi:esterase
MTGTATAEGTDRYVHLAGLRFHYVEWGSGDRPVLLMLHGLRSYAETFAGFAPALADRFRVLSLDQRGRGRTDWDARGEYHAERYVADLEAFVEALGLDTLHLLGHSMGGSNALLFAARHPRRVLSLIIEDSGPGASAGGAGAERIRRELAATPIDFDDWESGRRFWRSIRPNVTDAAIDSRVRHSLRETDHGRIGWRHDQAGIARARLDPATPIPDLWPAVDALACPTLLLRGADSDFLRADTAAEMARRNPRIRLREIPDAGHYVHDDQPQRFIAEIRAFLHEHVPGREGI